MTKRKENTMSHNAVATNWNGKTVEVTFKAGTEKRHARLDELADKAHKAFHRMGLYTIRLDLIDGERIPYAFQYSR